MCAHSDELLAVGEKLDDASGCGDHALGVVPAHRERQQPLATVSTRTAGQLHTTDNVVQPLVDEVLHLLREHRVSNVDVQGTHVACLDTGTVARVRPRLDVVTRGCDGRPLGDANDVALTVEP